MTTEITFPIVSETEVTESTTAKEVVHITGDELVRLIRELPKGNTFVSIDMEIDMEAKGKMNKKSRETGEGNPFFGIGLKKKETITGCCGYSYANAMQKALDGEGNGEQYVAKGRKWGTPLEVSECGAYKLVEHKGAYYIHLMGLSYDGKTMGIKFGIPVYEDAEGRVFEKAQLAEYLPKRSNSPIRCHDTKVCNIKAVRMNGKEYIVGEHTGFDSEHEDAAQSVQSEAMGA